MLDLVDAIKGVGTGHKRGDDDVPNDAIEITKAEVLA